jgi:hypothetical protein
MVYLNPILAGVQPATILAPFHLLQLKKLKFFVMVLPLNMDLMPSQPY